jgi:alpha-beta hydrolase superfamily lysophospholipase
VLGIYLAVGSFLVRATHRRVPPPPGYLHGEVVALRSSSGARLVAWLFVPPSARGAVAIFHGVHADRSVMLARAELLWRDGFAVLVPDLQAHGESSGDRVTFGFLESRDAEAGVEYLRRRFPRLRAGAIGVSLGGAAIALSKGRSRPDAAVLEAVFPTISEALDDRIAMRLGPLSRILTPLLLLQLKPRCGVGPEDLRPIDGVKGLGCPVLILAGTADRHTTEAQTRALFAAANEPKELWLVAGAAHVDLLRFDAAGYRTHVLGFLRRNLTKAPESGSTRDPNHA